MTYFQLICCSKQKSVLFAIGVRNIAVSRTKQPLWVALVGRQKHNRHVKLILSTTGFTLSVLLLFQFNFCGKYNKTLNNMLLSPPTADHPQAAWHREYSEQHRISFPLWFWIWILQLFHIECQVRLHRNILKVIIVIVEIVIALQIWKYSKVWIQFR